MCMCVFVKMAKQVDIYIGGEFDASLPNYTLKGMVSLKDTLELQKSKKYFNYFSKMFQAIYGLAASVHCGPSSKCMWQVFQIIS